MNPNDFTELDAVQRLTELGFTCQPKEDTMNTTFLSNYLTQTLIPALHEKCIHLNGDTYLVRNEDVFVHITDNSVEGDDRWFIVATPGWDGATTTVPIDVHHDDGAVVLTDNSVDIAWTGKLEHDVQLYLDTLHRHIIKVILPALWPKPERHIDVKKLRAIEGTLRTSSTDLWALTVDDPETATVESEKTGMTPEREAIHDLRLRLDQITTDLEDFINNTMTGSTEEPKTQSIVVLDDGETWAGGGCPVELTQAEYDRIMEGEKVHDVAPDRCNYEYGPWAD